MLHCTIALSTTMYVLINLRSLFDAWGYYLLLQKASLLAIGYDATDYSATTESDSDRTRIGDDDDYSTQSSADDWLAATSRTYMCRIQLCWWGVRILHPQMITNDTRFLWDPHSGGELCTTKDSFGSNWRHGDTNGIWLDIICASDFQENQRFQCSHAGFRQKHAP